MNNAAGGRLKQNTILCYFSRPHIPETETLKQPETVLAFAHDETEIKQNCRRSTETKQPTVGSFVLFQFLFHDVGLH